MHFLKFERYTMWFSPSIRNRIIYSTYKVNSFKVLACGLLCYVTILLTKTTAIQKEVCLVIIECAGYIFWQLFLWQLYYFMSYVQKAQEHQCNDT